MVCIVTGSSRGLGKAVAIALGKRGHRVAVHYRKRVHEAGIVASQIDNAIALKADAGDPVEVKNLVEEVTGTWGRVDLLVNNAGITKEALLLRTSREDLDLMLRTNLTGPFYFIRAVAPLMVKQGKGHIINISSFAGVKGKAGLSAYSSSKAALIGLGKTAAAEFGRYNIMVNTVLPGYKLTDMGVSSGNKAQAAALDESIVKEFSEPYTVAEFICHLSETSGITGQVFNLDSRIL
jgi:3-oxoacyl-[acyl-carrier protein] reductase